MQHTDLSSLLVQARAGQWNLADVDWAAVNPSLLPPSWRSAALGTLAQLHFGERVALGCAQRLERELPSEPARAVARLQVRDEARHVAWFSRVLSLLGGDSKPLVRPSMRRVMVDIQSAPLSVMVLGMHLVIEGMTSSVLEQSGELWRQSQADCGCRTSECRLLPGWVEHWLLGAIARDERRHVAFGSCLLRECWTTLSPSARGEWEQAVLRWDGMLHRTLEDPDLLIALGLDGHGFSHGVVLDANRQLSELGLVARFQAPPRGALAS